MTPTDAQRHAALQAALIARHPRARLISLRPSGELLLVAIALPDGRLLLYRTTTVDQPELAALGEHDRSRVHSALLALAQRGECGNVT